MRTFYYSAIKRLFDILSSLFALIVTFPIWVIVAIGIKVSSKGPIFYKAKRIGKDFRLFTLYKFRSMHVYDSITDGGNGEKGFIADKDRIFRFGSFLRKSKLDELPQLINIIQSQMSVVGPRPMSEKGARKFFVGEYACIYSVKPGLACLDSLFDYAHGELFTKDESEYANSILPVRTELARMYVLKKSFSMDVYCIIRTIQLIFQITIMKKKNFTYTKYETEAKNKLENEK